MKDRTHIASLHAGEGPYDEKTLRARRDRVGQWGIWRLVGQVLLAGEEPQERSALVRDVVADRPAQHRIAGLEWVEDRAQRGRRFDIGKQSGDIKIAAFSLLIEPKRSAIAGSRGG